MEKVKGLTFELVLLRTTLNMDKTNYFIKLVQFLVIVLLIINAFTFIQNVTYPKEYQRMSEIRLDSLAMKYEDPDDESILEKLR